MIARAVDGKAGEGAGGAQQLSSQGLLCQVVNAHVVLGGHQQEGLARVEEYPLHSPPVLAERILGGLLTQLVDHHSLEAQPHALVRFSPLPASSIICVQQ